MKLGRFSLLPPVEVLLSLVTAVLAAEHLLPLPSFLCSVQTTSLLCPFPYLSLLWEHSLDDSVSFPRHSPSVDLLPLCTAARPSLWGLNLFPGARDPGWGWGGQGKVLPQGACGLALIQKGDMPPCRSPGTPLGVLSKNVLPGDCPEGPVTTGSSLSLGTFSEHHYLLLKSL